MSEAEFEMVKILKENNKDMHIIAVGDDDQNIYEFREKGSTSSKYFASLLEWENCVKYELLDNYRSKADIVQLANDFAKNIGNRMKSSPIQAVQKENGEIKIVKYKSKNIIWGFVCDILKTQTRLIGATTCVLTRTNKEVEEVAGMLSQSGRVVKIIQSNEGIDLQNILEVRYFYENLGDNAIILEETWEAAKQKLNARFKNTNGLEIAENIIRDFEQTTQEKYKTDFEVFIKESKLEDFLEKESGNTIYVSTMHKAKGSEFDNIFIMLNNFYDKDDEKRLLYVAMTRAKNLLHIHCNDSFPLRYFQNVKIVQDNLDYSEKINRITMFLTHKRTKEHGGYINLKYFKDPNKKNEIEKLNGNEILQQGDLFIFSKEFRDKIEDLKSEGYHIKEIKINLIVYWKDKETTEEIKIILPSVMFER